MAKNMKRLLTICMALVFCISMMALPALAFGSHSQSYEWYEVYVQGNKVASGQGSRGNIYYLGRTYKAGASVSGSTLTWYIRPNQGNSGNFGGSVNLNDYITIPEGFEVKEIQVESTSVTGVNNEHDQYDNAIIKITIKTLYNELTQEEITVPTDPPTEPTDPPTEPTDPPTEPTDPPTEPTDPPTEPTDPPTEPTDPPTEPTDPPTEPTDPPVDYDPILTIEKVAGKEVYLVGETITWTITVKNTTEDPAYNVEVVDTLTDEIWFIDVLNPGEEKVYTTTLTASEVGTIENVALLYWEDGDENYLDDDDYNSSDDEIVTVEEPSIEPPSEPPVDPPTEPPVDPPTEPTYPPEPRIIDPPPPTEPEIELDEEVVEIEDEDVPLADVPETGDASILWAAMSALSAGGIFALNRKRKEEE